MKVNPVEVLLWSRGKTQEQVEDMIEKIIENKTGHHPFLKHDDDAEKSQ